MERILTVVEGAMQVQRELELFAGKMDWSDVVSNRAKIQLTLLLRDLVTELWETLKKQNLKEEGADE